MNMISLIGWVTSLPLPFSMYIYIYSPPDPWFKSNPGHKLPSELGRYFHKRAFKASPSGKQDVLVCIVRLTIGLDTSHFQDAARYIYLP